MLQHEPSFICQSWHKNNNATTIFIVGTSLGLKCLIVLLFIWFVNRDEFKGQSALIIGGSRGLGEVTAKLLAAGSADVRLSYYQGEEDAIGIVDDISSNGGCAEYFQYKKIIHKNVRTTERSIVGRSIPQSR